MDIYDRLQFHGIEAQDNSVSLKDAEKLLDMFEKESLRRVHRDARIERLEKASGVFRELATSLAEALDGIDAAAGDNPEYEPFFSLGEDAISLAEDTLKKLQAEEAETLYTEPAM